MTVRMRRVGANPRSSARATYAYKEVAGVCLEFDVIGAQPGEGQPCVMWIQGGGLIFGSRKASPRPPFLRALLERDVVVVSIDHRLAPETKLPGIVEDVRDAWHWLHEFGRRRLGVDPSRIAIAGASSGAYLAIMAGYALEEAPRAIASFWGFGDITAPWEAEPSAHYRQMALVTREEAEASLCAAPDADVGMDRSAFYLHCRQQGAWLVEVTGHDPREKPEWFDRYCPIRNINPRFPSTMLVHGVADNDVPHEQSAQLAARFAQAGIDHRFISLDGIGHGFANATPEQAEAVEREVADFLLARLT